ncbi:MAG: DUF4968 domain-containing protein, partial [Duncaniella sp.]|nr:DUF4968 domain-containing protein [Duncaniella sp.]
MPELRTLLLAAAATLTLGATAAPTTMTSRGMDISVEFFAPDVVRVLKVPAGSNPVSESLVVVAKPADVAVTETPVDGFTPLTSDSLMVRVNLATSGVEFLDRRGQRL